jgi:hypothetical protein
MDLQKRPGSRRRGHSLRPGLVAALALMLAIPLVAARPALALSEIGQEAAPSGEHEDAGPPDGTLPLPGPTAVPEAEEPVGENAARPEIEPDDPLPEVIYNLDRLPEPVRRMHRLLLEATRSGDIEKLRPLIGTGESATQLSFGGVDGDPVDFLRELSGDPEGHEILAILEEVLNAGFVHLEAGTASDLYVWPYFFAIPLDRLTSPQRVELFKIVTAGDFEDMKAFGSYIFYRVGIDPDGNWAFFVAGD